MSYLTKYDNVVMQKCKVMQNNRNIQLKNIAQGRVTTSIDGGYVAKTPKSSLEEFKTKYQLDDKKFKQMVTIVNKMEIAETDELELLYAELEEILGLEDSFYDLNSSTQVEQIIQQVEQIIQQLPEDQTDNDDGTDSQTDNDDGTDSQTDNDDGTDSDLPDWLQEASQEMLSSEVLEVLPYPDLFEKEPPPSPSPSRSSVNLVSPISQESIASPDLFTRESPRINTRVSSPNQPRLPTQGSSSNEALQGSSSNEALRTERGARAIARSQRTKSPSKAVQPKNTPRIPKGMNINTGSTSRNITGKEADEYFAFLDKQPHFNPNVDK